jgi:hypothetical protein
MAYSDFTLTQLRDRFGLQVASASGSFESLAPIAPIELSLLHESDWPLPRPVFTYGSMKKTVLTAMGSPPEIGGFGYS